MKRRTSSMIASILSVSALGMQALPIFAETSGQETAIEVKTVQDFLNYYLSTKNELVDGNGNVVVNYIPITYVDDTNYWMVLSAKSFYDLLSSNVIFIVDGQYFVPKSQEQMNKDLALKEAIDLYFAQDNYFDALVKDAQAKDQEIKAAQEEAMQQEILNQADLETKEEMPKVEFVVDSSKENEEAKEEMGEEVVEDVVKVGEGASLAINLNQADNLFLMAKPIEEMALKQDLVEVEEELIVESAIQAPIEIVEDVIPEMVSVEMVELSLEEAMQPMETVVKEQSASTAAQNFVSTYLTSSSGNIYAQANEINFQTILNSLSAWNKLSNGDKEQVNSILIGKVGKNYQTLLQEAQTIKYGGIVNGKSVQTGVENNAGFYAAMCGLSAFVFGFITRRKGIE